jgi:hypothetical protein
MLTNYRRACGAAKKEARDQEKENRQPRKAFWAIHLPKKHRKVKRGIWVDMQCYAKMPGSKIKGFAKHADAAHFRDTGLVRTTAH